MLSDAELMEIVVELERLAVKKLLPSLEPTLSAVLQLPQFVGCVRRIEAHELALESLRKRLEI